MNPKETIFALGAAAGALGALVLLRPRSTGLPKAAIAPTALVTGGSSGIGATFARKLAALGYDLVLVARRADRLEALAAELRAGCGVQVATVPADLTRDADVARVEAVIRAIPNLDLLINNAGFGVEGRFSRADIEPQIDMIRLHVLASVRLARAALDGMIARRRGGIINVASVAGFLALPGSVNYCATKGYLITFSRALALELGGTGVRVQALCPGFTHTEFHDDLKDFDKRRSPSFLWMPADAVVTSSLAGLARNEVVCIPGLGNRLLAVLGSSPLTDLVAPWLLR